MSEHEGSGSGARESLEIERKYEARLGAELPTAGRLREAGFAADAPLSFSLRAQYLDTPGEDLAAQGVAVRERHGGSDAGWHLKQRGPEGVRELHWPAAERMPEGLREEIRARIGEAVDAVRPLARIDTERTVVLLRDATGAAVVELADDRVLAADAAGVRRAWREWEAELVPGAEPALLERVEPLLLEAGAEPSLSAAKIARATGRLVELAERQGADAAVLAALRELDTSDREAARRLGS
ncbi:CYTH domain-containing protein [Leucobacter massiliensis]|uniref:CYTH domain-containing protein n=1 Tax=Leucobacter massiliensis TaxID=1686285 RepID=UPI0015E2EBC3|nr:CYTH domain-containing protein [Leucobacter massiliensis]